MKLSEFELTVLSLLWQSKESSAPEIHKNISKTRKVTYSTVKTIVDRLEKKGAIKRTKNKGRTIFYTPTVQQSATQKPLVQKFIDKVFAGNPRLLMNHLLQEEKLNQEDLDFLQEIINKRKS